MFTWLNRILGQTKPESTHEATPAAINAVPSAPNGPPDHSEGVSDYDSSSSDEDRPSRGPWYGGGMMNDPLDYNSADSPSTDSGWYSDGDDSSGSGDYSSDHSDNAGW